MKSLTIPEVEPQFEKKIDPFQQQFQQLFLQHDIGCETPTLSARRQSSIFEETLTPDPSVYRWLLDTISEDEHMNVSKDPLRDQFGHLKFLRQIFVQFLDDIYSQRQDRFQEYTNCYIPSYITPFLPACYLFLRCIVQEIDVQQRVNSFPWQNFIEGTDIKHIQALPFLKGIAPGKYDDSNPEAAWTSINQTGRRAIHLSPQSVESNLILSRNVHASTVIQGVCSKGTVESIRSAVSTIFGLITGKVQIQANLDAQLFRDHHLCMGANQYLNDKMLQAKAAALLLINNFVRVTEMQQIECGSIQINQQLNQISFQCQLKTSEKEERIYLDENPAVEERLSTIKLIQELIGRVQKRTFNKAAHLFLKPNSLGALSVSQISDLIRTLLQEAGLDTKAYGVYSLKAAGISEQFEQGKSLKQMPGGMRAIFSRFDSIC
ncbi:MAG: hypothetical protein EZS28_003960 [Streblomastix strix]|uniref:Uncharacterized protein n=1 Tax=Streblomastix strix TaxID=222440 RepID=A0A5J4X177_9EUKA|nr:MAG: hypothetical protein EZS28_003960 [Streblomastix strix]